MDDLLSAPEQIKINGREYVLQTELSRNFMPWATPPGGGPLIGAITVIALDSLPIPSKQDATHIWIINGDDLWDSGLINRSIPYGYEYEMKKRIEDPGPKWDTGIYVDVVVEVLGDDGTAYLLMADSQVVAKIY